MYMKDEKFYLERNRVVLSIILSIYNCLSVCTHPYFFFLYLSRIKLIYS